MIRTESLTDVYFFTFRMCQHILTFAQPGDSTYTISLHHLSKYDTTVHISICDNLNNGNVPPAGDPRSLTISSRNFPKIPIIFLRYFPERNLQFPYLLFRKFQSFLESFSSPVPCCFPKTQDFLSGFLPNSTRQSCQSMAPLI